MKKFFGLALAGIMAASTVAFAAPAYGVSADEAAATVIKPFALYEFQDASKPGKDTSGNGYDLVAKTMGSPECLQIKEENGVKYLSLDSMRDSEGNSTGKGGILYAPAVRGKKDFSDMLRESYTIEIEFRRDNASWIGDHYLLMTGKYNNAFGITPWRGGIEYQVFNQQIAQGANDQEKFNWLQAKLKTYYTTIDTSDWTKVMVVGNAEEDKVYIYENGTLVNTIEMDDVLLSYPDQAYTFCIGGQAEYDGNAATMFATADVKRCVVYDTALSATNVAKVFNGEDAVIEDGQKYVTSIAEIDTSALDLQVTDVNNLDKIMNETLPQSVKVNYSDGKEKNTKVFWYEKNGKINGYIQSAYANPECKELSVDYSYTVKINYDSSLVTVTDITLNDEAYVPGTAVNSGKYEVAFKVTPVNQYVTVNDVLYNDISWTDEDGIYYVEIKGGAYIDIAAAAKKFTVTYKDGDNSLGTSKYTYGGNEAMKTAPEKEGYTFEGWYSDASFSADKKVEALDYNNPANITLYAKYVKIGGNSGSGSTDNGGNKGGCKSSVAGIGGVAMLMGVAAVYTLARKKKDD